MNSASNSPGRQYLAIAQQLLARLCDEEWPKICQASELIAAALERNKTVHVFGTGHSHMLAEELFYRAGGLVRVKPILFEGLMLHSSAPLSTTLERLPGLAAALLSDHPVAEGDVLIAASNSGSNAVTSELVQQARSAGASVIAITSMQHSTSKSARPTDLPRLYELADIVIDNGGCVGDAAIEIEGFAKRVSPTSSVIGTAILNAIVAETVHLLVERGFAPEVYSSSNTTEGDAANHRFLQRGAPV